MVDGKALTSFSSSVCSQRHPRTAAGLSRDRKTLYLAVVDGRWSASVGMTCAELGALMVGLGAYDAINLDGGGSSTMWLKGKGVVNHPSDGAQRVVGNHLAIIASGKGAPRSCDYTMEELALQAAAHQRGGTSDIDGDGRADACARGSAGIQCGLSSGASLAQLVTGPSLSDAKGWKDRTNYATIATADVTGDGRADLCARSNEAMLCWPAEGSGFGSSIAGPKLSDAKGWNLERRFSTIRLADIDGDGMDDICARAATDFRCWRSTGKGFGGAVVGPPLSDAKGWNSPYYYGTIRMGDIDGDGKADLCARAAAGIRCWRSTGVGFSAALDGPKLSDAAGWSDLRYYSTIRLADVNGDGRADLCARAAAGFRCWCSTGAGFGDAIVGPALSDAAGWSRYSRYSTIRMADLNGDGRADSCARGGKGVLCWLSDGKGFPIAITGPALSDAAGWDQPHYFRSLRLADLDGDGRADLCARSSDGLKCWRFDGKAFSTAVSGPAWTKSAGWNAPQYYSTLRIAGPSCRPGAEVCDGKDNDCDGQVDEGCGTGDAGPAVDGGGGQNDLDALVAPDGEVDGAAGGASGCSLSGQGDRRGLLWPALLILLVLRTRGRRRGARALRRGLWCGGPGLATALLVCLAGACAPDQGHQRFGENMWFEAMTDAYQDASRETASPQLDAGADHAPPSQLRVVQCNPYYAGRLAPHHMTGGSCSSTKACSKGGRVLCTSPGAKDGCWECIDGACRQRTWETFAHAAGLINAISADMVGVQELPPEYAPRIDALLEKKTNESWEYIGSAQGINGHGSGNHLFWRSRTVDLVRDLGNITVDTLPTGYLLRFHGGLFRPRGSPHSLGFFSGKLYWDKSAASRRASEALKLRRWIHETMKPLEPLGATARIVAIDLNDTRKSKAYQVFSAEYDDGGAIKPTAPGLNPDIKGGRRIDYLFWDDGKPGAPTQGFLGAKSDGRLGRSEYFGSDHRFVYADAQIP